MTRLFQSPPRQRVILAHHIQLGGLGVFDDLLDALTSGDRASDGGMLETPGERPARHGSAGRQFGLLDLLHLPKHRGDLLWVLRVADVARRELRAGLVFAGEEAAGERHARENAEVEPLAYREDL